MSKEKQIEESYELIMNAFLTLLNDKPFDEITLSEIALKAGVARMTLYRHFKTKEQILIYRADSKLEFFKQTLEQNSFSAEEFVNNFLIFFSELPLRHLITTDEQINKIFHTYILELREHLYLHLKKLNYSKLDEYTFSFLIGGINELIKNWIKNNFEDDSIYLTEKIMTFVDTLK